MQVVELNVGGCLFTTTRTTLCQDSNSMLAKMFSEDSELPPAYRDSQGRFFIDRDGKQFHTILSYLRGQPFELPTSRSDREALAEEARFFQLTGFLDCVALRQASNSGSGTAAVSLDMLATLAYEEAHAMLIAHARDLLGHRRVQSICNAIVRQYFCGGINYHGLTPGLLFTLHHAHHDPYKQSTRWWGPGSRPAIDVPGINDEELLQVVSMHAGLFKHDLALRGFNLSMINTEAANYTATGWTVSPL